MDNSFKITGSKKRIRCNKANINVNTYLCSVALKRLYCININTTVSVCKYQTSGDYHEIRSCSIPHLDIKFMNPILNRFTIGMIPSGRLTHNYYDTMYLGNLNSMNGKLNYRYLDLVFDEYYINDNLYLDIDYEFEFVYE